MMEDYKNGLLNEYLDKNSNVVTVQGKNESSSDTHSLKEEWKQYIMDKYVGLK